MNVSPLYAVLAFVALERVAEAIYGERNARALLRLGAREVAVVQYPFLVVLHAAWLLSMLLFVPAYAPVSWPLIAAYGALQIARLWVFAALGPRWTARIVVLPGAPLVRTGPYRFLRHPNYAIVVLEIALLPAAFGAYWIAAAFSVLNAPLLWWRVRAEDAALAASG